MFHTSRNFLHVHTHNQREGKVSSFVSVTVKVREALKQTKGLRTRGENSQTMLVLSIACTKCTKCKLNGVAVFTLTHIAHPKLLKIFEKI
jgi:hypothetical protein